MRIPPYWAKGRFTARDRDGREQVFEAFGWSFESNEAAAQEGRQRAERVHQRLSRGVPSDDYDYLDRPLREETLETVAGPEGKTIAAVTRNHYGARILNTASVCFVDVDFPAPRAAGFWDAVMMAFSAKRRRERQREAETTAIETVYRWYRKHPERALRLYRTAGGLRLLLTDDTYEPTSAVVAEIFEAVGSDPLYRRLTAKQDCFRARLTPKPWRCGCERPPNRYPWATPEAEAAYRAWEREYESAAGGHTVCRLVEELGTMSDDPVVAAVVALHDRQTCRGTRLPLA